MDVDKANKLITEAANRLVSQLIKSRGHDTPPFSPEEYAHLLSIKIVKAKLGKVNAALVESGEGYIIKVNEVDIPARQRFSCAHEIGHVLFNQEKLETHVQTIEYRSTFDPSGTYRARAKARERLCDVAATELLMPAIVFGRYLHSLGISISSLHLLAKIFAVSIQSTAIRIAELSPEPCLILIWKFCQRGRSKGLRLSWNLSSNIIGGCRNPYALVNTYADETSGIYDAYKNDCIVKSHKVFKTGSGKERFPIESKGFGYGEHRFVISMALLK